MKRRALLVMTLTLLPVVASGTAVAAPAGSAGVERGPGYVIVDRSVIKPVVTSRGDFYDTGYVGRATAVILTDEDGAMPAGLTREAVRANARSGRPVAAPQLATEGSERSSAMALSTFSFTANPFGWTMHSDGIGHMLDGRMPYRFQVQAGSSARAVGQGRGFYRGYNGGSYGVWAAWYGLGQATSNSSSGATVPWDNITATKQFQAKSSSGHFVTGKWW